MEEINAILEEEQSIEAVIDLEALAGPQGEDGDSAYEVAVANGFEGTEEEWLESLKQGPKGDAGRGIVNIELISSDGLVDNYRITYTDGTVMMYTVTNGADGKPFTYDDFTLEQLAALEGTDGVDGRGIVSIERTSSEGLVDTYTIAYTDNTTSTFTVTNGEDGEDGQGYIDTSEFATWESVEEVNNRLDEIDLSSYATTEELEAAVDGMATTDYVDGAVKEIDLTAYATTEYVEELVGNAEMLLQVLNEGGGV